jgi:hypothetical protein
MLTPEQRARGGRNSRKGTTVRTVPDTELPTDPQDTIEGLSAWTIWITRATATGQMDRQTANIVLKGLGLQKIVLDRLIIDKRLKEIERRLAQKP